MSNLEKKMIYVKINYKDDNEVKKYKNEKYKKQFNWKHYLSHYKDLKLNNLDDTWNHWVNHGIREKRKFFLYREKEYKKPVNKKDSNDDAKFREESENLKKKIKQTVCEKKNLEEEILSNNNNNNNNNSVKINLIRKHNLIYKNTFDDYDTLYYFGWKEVINNFINLYDHNLYNFDKQFFFDICIEKLLVLGNKSEKKLCLREIYNNDYKIITFIHNPPFQKWYKDNYRDNINDKIIFNNNYTNKNLFKMIENNTLEDNICYFYTFTNSHKEYIYNKCPLYKNKLLTITYPILISDLEKKFDINLFNQNKQIFHIGWRYRNFKSFIDFNKPKEYQKTILIKKEFEQEWNKLSHSYKLDEITILKELNNIEYEKIFTNSCIFIHLEDASAHNLVLECIKFNTPIIINKLQPIVEYLGEDYPLYYENSNDLQLLHNPNYFQKQIISANNYIINMDKTKFKLDTFNKKINYDLKKLEICENKKLTWYCLISDLNDIDSKFYNLYNNFISQNNSKNLKLKLIISEHLKKNSTDDGIDFFEEENVGNIQFNLFMDKIIKYCELMNNISYKIEQIGDSYSNFLNSCFKKCDTHYMTIVDLDDEHDVKFSETCINYLNNDPCCDLLFSSYTISNNNYEEKFIFEKDILIFKSNFSNINLPETSIVWRKDLYDIINEFINLNDRKYIFRAFWDKCINYNLNIKCCSNDILFKRKIY
jgi:hypothetical protein